VAVFVRGEANDPTDPKLQLFLIDATNQPIDASHVGFRILNITNEKNKCLYANQDFPKIQVYPSQGPQFINVTDLTTAPEPGHKISTGRYYAPWTASETLKLGEYVIIWEWRINVNSPYRVNRQSFVIKEN
jgi:hypothetical protein